VRARGGDGESGGDLAGASRIRSGVPVGRGEGDARQAGPSRQRESGKGAEERRADGPGKRPMGRARAGEEKREKEKRAARGGELGWTGEWAARAGKKRKGEMAAGRAAGERREREKRRGEKGPAGLGPKERKEREGKRKKESKCF
jgi:hypothetical protein